MEFKHHLLITLAISLFVLSHSHFHHQPDKLSSCLIDSKVYNFTLREKNPSEFFKFLDISIQNLRFEGPSIPKPAAIIIPGSREQLISSVLCCRRGSWEMRVRSGGHSYEGTSYIAYDGDEFVLIDIMSLDRVSVDVESETAWVESGATLGQLYYAISQASNVHGFPGGACPTVGVGGHLSGGGFGSLFRKYGLAADNVVDALLVDANGRFLDRVSMGEDVFWAIRGGGGGVFGIVFAWKIRLVKVPENLTGFTVSRAGTRDYVERMVDKWQNVAPKLESEFYLSLVLDSGLTFKGLYLGPKHVALSILDNVFPELRLLEGECREMSWIESILFLSGLKQGSSIFDLNNRYSENRYSYKAKSDFVRTAFSRKGIAMAIDMLAKERKGYIILDPYGGAMVEIRGDSIPFPHRKGNLFIIQYVVVWSGLDNPDVENRYMRWMREFHGAMAPYVSSNPRAAYVNYMDFDIGVMEVVNGSSDGVEEARVWGEKYFLQNYDRLVRIKTKIDPFNVFRHEQGIFPVSIGIGKADV